MKKQNIDKFQRTRGEFEVALDNFLAALDKEHYPDSLRESMAAVLKAPGAPRGLPLFLHNLDQSGGGDFSSSSLVACECFLRAFLLLAQLGTESNSEIRKSLLGRLYEKYSRAQLLLTADTFFTWPIELIAGETVSDSTPLLAALAEAFGIRGCLAALDNADSVQEGLLGLDPFTELILALGISDIESNKKISSAARWIYYNELKHWFGRAAPVEQALKEIEVDLSVCAEPQVMGFAELISFLRD